MTYIIDPIWFYLMGIIGNLGVTLGILSAITVVATIAYHTYVWYQITENSIQTTPPVKESHHYEEDVEEFAWYKRSRWVRRWLIVCSILVMLLATITPSKETMIQMMVASTVTKENINYTTDTIRDMVDYIFDKLESDE